MRVVILFFVAFGATSLFGGIDCPSDIHLVCPQSLDQVSLDVVYGNGAHAGMTAKYVDQQTVVSCGDWQMERRWYIDLNSDDEYSIDEPSCIQHITFSDSQQGLNVQFPDNVTMQCTFDDSIDLGKPTYDASFCRNIAVSHLDKLYGDTLTSCYKIFRTYTVISMCVNPYDGSWIEDEVIEHTQAIKVVDDEAPTIRGCADKVISVGADCETELTLDVVAEDNEACSSGDLAWTISVDLWNDGSVDYTYGGEESGDFYLAPTTSGESVAVTLPEAVGTGYHNVEYKVRDACGNYGVCIQKIETKDLKPPTPYCNAPLFLTLNGRNGDSLIVNVDIFNNGAVDNCGGEVTLSFEKDTIVREKIIKCGQAGFQFNRIWHSDRSGNQDFCGARYLVFDNGSCGARQTTYGRVQSYLPSHISWRALLRKGTEVQMIFPVEDDAFSFRDHALYSDMNVTLMPDQEVENVLSLSSFIRLRNYLIGRDTLDQAGLRAADMDDDGRVSSADLFSYRDYLLGRKTLAKSYRMYNPDFSKRVDAYPLSAYTGSFDFAVIGVGSIERISSSTRDNRPIYFTKVATPDGYQYTTESDIMIQGLYLRSTKGSSVSLNEQNVHTNADKNRLLWMGNVPAHTLGIFTTQDSDMEVVLVDEHGDELKSHILGEEIEIQASGDGTIDIFGDVASVQLFRIDGRSVSFNKTSFGLKHMNIKPSEKGLYIVSCVSNGKVISKIIHT